MAKKRFSLLTDDLDHCIVCGRPREEIHHIFYGYSSKNRLHSEEDGLIIPLCNKHHTGSFTTNKDAIHHNEAMDFHWKRLAQLAWEEAHPGESFMKRYGKNYVY